MQESPCFSCGENVKGENQDGEDIMISIAQTGIIEKVWQRNGKLRVDEYNKDGFFVSQKYEGD